MDDDATSKEPCQGSRARSTLQPWGALLVGALSSYGTPSFNYGFALYFLTYRHGFVKRALIGEAFSPLTFLPRTSLLAIEYVFLAAAFAATYVVFRGLLFGIDSERKLATALLAAPALLPHIGYLFAQPDVTLYLLLLVCIAFFVRTKPETAALVTCPLCCVGLLAHEAFCLMFYPVIVAILLHVWARRRLPWIVGVAHVLTVTVAFVAIIHWGTLKVSPDVLLREAQARTNVGIQRQVFDVMASTFSQQQELVHRMYTHDVLRTLVLTLFLSVPYFVLLAHLLYGSMRAGGCRAFQITCTFLLFVSPLLLCVLGHDTTRWIGAMCIDATFFVLYLCLTEPRDGSVRRILLDWADGPSYLPWLVYLVAVGPYGATGMRTAGELLSAWYGP